MKESGNQMNYEITLSFRTQGEQAVFRVISGFQCSAKKSLTISELNDKCFAADCHHLAIVGAETVHIELLNHDSDYFRPYEYAVAAIVRESSSFSLVYERLFGKKMIRPENVDYMWGCDFLINIISDYFLSQSEAREEKNEKPFRSNFDVADSICRHQFAEDNSFMEYWKNWQGNLSNQGANYDWADLLEGMLCYLLND